MLSWGVGWHSSFCFASLLSFFHSEDVVHDPPVLLVYLFTDDDDDDDNDDDVSPVLKVYLLHSLLNFFSN